MPVFPSYDLPGQFEVISQVAARCDIPLPALRWNEPDGGPLGTPFFVMDQVDGRIPLDNPPYVFAGWLLEATPEERARLQRASIAILAKVHAIAGPAAAFPALRPPRRRRTRCGGTSASSTTTTAGRWPTTASGCRSSSGAWTGWRSTGRATPGPDVLSWGDARIGNIIYAGFEPAAVLDWEMACARPARAGRRAGSCSCTGSSRTSRSSSACAACPTSCAARTWSACYTELTGHPLRDMDFYLVYAALRHAIVMARIKRRMIHFGEDQVPGDPDDYVMHRASLDKLLAGTYRWD